MLVDLHADPFERAEDEAADYAHWRIDRVYLLVAAQAFVGQWLQSFKKFPPRQKQRASVWTRSCKKSPDRKTETTESIGHPSRQGEKGHTVIFDGYIPGSPKGNIIKSVT